MHQITVSSIPCTVLLAGQLFTGNLQFFLPCLLEFVPFLDPPCSLSPPPFLTPFILLCLAYGLITGALIGNAALLPPSFHPSHLFIVLGTPLRLPSSLIIGALLPPSTEQRISGIALFLPLPSVIRVPIMPPPLSSTTMGFLIPSHSFIVIGTLCYCL